MSKETKRMKITEETIKNVLIDICGWTKESDFGVFTYYRSPCKRYVLQESDSTNLFDPNTMKGWNLHIDNSDMQSLASCDIEYMDQLSMLMTVYGGY